MRRVKRKIYIEINRQLLDMIYVHKSKCVHVYIRTQTRSEIIKSLRTRSLKTFNFDKKEYAISPSI